MVQLDPAAAVRLRRRGATGIVTAWASTPFEVLATRSVPGTLEPADVAVPAVALLTALAVERAGTVDPGAGALWRAELPPDTGWADGRRACRPAELAELVERGLASAAADGTGHGPSAALLDGRPPCVPARPGPRCGSRCAACSRCPGWACSPSRTRREPVRVSATGSWLRLDTPGGAVVRRRITALPLLV